MKIVKFKAGLGNQMFQYAFLRLLQEKYIESDVLADTSYFDCKDYKKYLDNGINLLAVNYLVANKHQLHNLFVPYNNFRPHHFMHRAVAASQAFLNPNYYFEKNRSYVAIEEILKFDYFDGYWQSWRYLEPIREKLLMEFRPATELSELTKSYMDNYRQLNSVFIGVRKGDYTQSKKEVSHYGIPSLYYYKKAISFIIKTINDPYFIVFSDDIEWVKKNLNFNGVGIADYQVEYRDQDKIFSNFEEIYVMSSCKHAIISNSTFNFWGAWLIDNPNKIVVAPKVWFKDGKPIDIIPPEWVQI